MSRSTVIKEVSNSITGTFQLYDLLSISTISGSINITILPQPASSAKAEAELRLATTSGSIKVTMAPFLHDPSAVIPERIFTSSLKSMSGSINAALIHNHRTSLSTMSGNVTASLYPLAQPHPTSHVDIRCMSGSTSLILHPRVHSPRTSLRTLSADFRGSSGSLKVRFPSTWEGKVVSNLSSGRVRHEWEGLRVLKDGPSFAATKGNGSGQLSVRGGSMSVELAAERVPGLPSGEEMRGEGRCERGLEDEDDWTVVGDEDGAREAGRRPPPPSYEEAIRK